MNGKLFRTIIINYNDVRALNELKLTIKISGYTFQGIDTVHYVRLCDLRAKLMVACLVTPALWLNLSDSRNILIIHFGLLLKERSLDSIGHDLWKNI